MPAKPSDIDTACDALCAITDLEVGLADATTTDKLRRLATAISTAVKAMEIINASSDSPAAPSITGDIVHVGDLGPKLTGMMVRIDREKLKAFHANLAYSTVTITPVPKS